MQSLLSFKKLVQSEAGAAMAEYAVLVAIMALAIVITITALGNSISALLYATGNFLSNLKFG